MSLRIGSVGSSVVRITNISAFPRRSLDHALAVGPFIKGLIATSFVCFGVSLMLAAFVMVYFSREINMMTQEQRRRQAEDPSDKELQWDPRDHVLRWGRHQRVIDVNLLPFYRRIFVTADVFWDVIRYPSALQLPFFTTGLLCFGLAVVVNLYR
jgi:phosphotransferase system  glucose/maltose/N-acetylglucosamine-specific IIC component